MRRFRSAAELEEHRKEHTELDPVTPEDFEPWERVVSCSEKNPRGAHCGATFRTMKARDEHKRIFHAKLW
jgi:hypothetical protein